jgi:hypothetical protein
MAHQPLPNEGDTMNKRQMRLPREGVVQADEAVRTPDVDDVEGHGLPTTAPPSYGRAGLPGHGGENIPTPVDDEDDRVTTELS